MRKEEVLKIQKCVLKVNVHCDGCKRKVKKILQKIDGVFTIEIDAEAGKVTVSGNVEPGILIKKLRKSKKYAEICGLNPKTNNEITTNLEIENAEKVLLPLLKGLQMPPNHKPVKFQLPHDHDLTDEDDLHDLDDDDDFEDDGPNKVKPFMGGISAGGGGGRQIPNINMQQLMHGNGDGGCRLKAMPINGNASALGGGNQSLSDGGARNGNHNGCGSINNDMGHVMKDARHGFPNMGVHLSMPPTGMAAGGSVRPMKNMQMTQMDDNLYQQQQYMAAMMNHQRTAMVNQPMMYSRPPSAVNYLPLNPYPPQPGGDNYRHFFSDENTSSCNVM